LQPIYLNSLLRSSLKAYDHIRSPERKATNEKTNLTLNKGFVNASHSQALPAAAGRQREM
jgi:hypothetical protein